MSLLPLYKVDAKFLRLLKHIPPFSTRAYILSLHSPMREKRSLFSLRFVEILTPLYTSTIFYTLYTILSTTARDA